MYVKFGKFGNVFSVELASDNVIYVTCLRVSLLNNKKNQHNI